MPINHQFPYTNLHDLNVDWILQTIKKLEKVYDQIPDDIQANVDKWLNEHPEATTTVQDGTITKVKMAENTLDAWVLIPDEFDGTDTEKLQACFDAVIEHGGHIVINRALDIYGNIYIEHSSNNDFPIYVHGLGQNAQINMHDYSFTSNWVEGLAQGNVIFSDIWFIGSQTCFDGNGLIRLYFTNCYFTSFFKVFSSGGEGSNRLQTIYVTNCVFRRNHHVFYIGGQANDVRAVNSNFEYNQTCYYCEAGTVSTGCAFISNLFEGMRNIVFMIKQGRSFNIDYNYFEGNHENIDVSDGASRGVTIIGNMCPGGSASWAGTVFVYLPNTSPLYTSKFSNVIKHNSMVYLTCDLIGFRQEPTTALLDWNVSENYCPDIPDRWMMHLNRGDNSAESFGVPIADLDAGYVAGFYTVDSNTANNPAENSTGNLQVFQGAGTQLVQIYIPTDTAHNKQIYKRTGLQRMSGGQYILTWATWDLFSPGLVEKRVPVSSGHTDGDTIAVKPGGTYIVTATANGYIGIFAFVVTSNGRGFVLTLGSNLQSFPTLDVTGGNLVIPTLTYNTVFTLINVATSGAIS